MNGKTEWLVRCYTLLIQRIPALPVLSFHSIKRLKSPRKTRGLYLIGSCAQNMKTAQPFVIVRGEFSIKPVVRVRR